MKTAFVRHRNALLAQAELGELYVDYYLHLATNNIRHDEEHDRLFKEALAAFILHCASCPRNEIIAWTINFQEPLINLFLVADNEDGTVAGRVFTDFVKKSDENLFFSETIRGRAPLRRSAVSFTGNDPFLAVEHFYERSEQRPARYFHLHEEEVSMLSAHPDCDMNWFSSVDADSIRQIDALETIRPLETRFYRWRCGCNQARILCILAPSMRKDPDELFAGEEALKIDCPRCGARYAVTRETLEAYVAQAHVKDRK